MFYNKSISKVNASSFPIKNILSEIENYWQHNFEKCKVWSYDELWIILEVKSKNYQKDIQIGILDLTIVGIALIKH